MSSKLIVAAVLGFALAGPVLAQSSSGSSSGQSSSGSASSSGQSRPGTGGASNTSIRQHITQDLAKAGFKNVQLTPMSFMARATDQQGRPVVMMIDPDSVTTFTALGTPGQSGSGQSASSGSGSGSGGSGSGSSNPK